MKRLLAKLAPVAGEIGWLVWRSAVFVAEMALLAAVLGLVLFGAHVLGPAQ